MESGEEEEPPAKKGKTPTPYELPDVPRFPSPPKDNPGKLLKTKPWAVSLSTLLNKVFVKLACN